MSRFTPIADALAASGWTIQCLELSSDCWWAKEIWKLKSEWSPKDKEIFLSLLIDPCTEIDKNNPPDSAVWAVALTKNLPLSRHDGGSSTISIKRRMEAAVSDLVRISNDLRAEN